MHTSNHYQILGLNSDASETEIKQAYKSLVVKIHPDKNLGSTVADENFKMLSEAYNILSDPHSRMRYDALLIKSISRDIAHIAGPRKDPCVQLYDASKRGDVQAIISSFKLGGRPQWRNPTDDGRTALHAAAYNGHTEAMLTLLSLGADANAQNLYRDTPLHEGSAAGQREAALALLRHGASLNSENKYGATGLFPHSPPVPFLRALRPSILSHSILTYSPSSSLAVSTTSRLCRASTYRRSPPPPLSSLPPSLSLSLSLPLSLSLSLSTSLSVSLYISLSLCEKRQNHT